MKTGKIYAVSVGPGDPLLMTQKAVRTIEHCRVVAYPVTRSGQTLARDIAAQAADLADKCELPLMFCMGQEADYSSAASRIEQHLNKGEDVALLSLGDISMYATGSRILRILKSHGWEFSVIPGVPSFCAAAACLGECLVEGNESLHIIPDADAASLDLPGTKVFMKSGGRLPELIRIIRENGKNGIGVKNCGLPQEEIYTDLSLIPQDAGYFVTIVVKE